MLRPWWAAWRRSSRRARQLEDELRFHLEAETEAKMRRGLAEAEARRLTRAELGGSDRWREEVREQRPGHTLALAWRDLRYGARTLRRSPAYSLAALATLALGIAALAAITTLTSSILLRPLPYEDPDRIVVLWERNLQRNRDKNVVGAASFEAWRARSRTLESITAFLPTGDVWRGGDLPERVFGAEVSASMFDVLGRRPLLGAGFTSPAATGEVVLSHAFWSRRMGADSAVIGRALRLGDQSLTVVGVMPNDFAPARFGWLAEQEYWTPLTVGPQHSAWGRFLVVAARMKPGVTLVDVNRELGDIAAQLNRDQVIADGWDARALTLADEMTGTVEPALVALCVATLVLLALVLVNTSLLTLAHLRQRAADRALRVALGATRVRLVRERFMSSALLALLGAVLGAMLGAMAIPGLVRVLPADIPRLDGIRFDAIALAAVAGSALLVMLVLSVLPTGTAAAVIGTHGRRLTASRSSGWLIAAEAGLALVLAFFASLTLRSFERLRSVDVGFATESLLAFRLSLNDAASPAAAFDGVMQRIRALPGVTAAGLVSVRPFGAGGSATTVGPLGSTGGDRSGLPTAEVRLVDAEFFRVLGIPPSAGRVFSGREAEGAPTQAVVSEAFVRALWGDESAALGRRFDLRMFGSQSPEIVGVVRDMRLLDPRQPGRPTVFLAASQFPSAVYDVVLRSSTTPAALIPAIAATVAREAPGSPVYSVEEVAELVAASMARERVTALLLAFFAGSALLLVGVGVYGLFAGDVARGRREIGVRMALGESAGRVLRAMLSRALLRALVGVGIGAATGLLATRGISSLLYGVAPGDPVSLVAAALVVLLAALAGTFIPAWQAAHVDPARALRSE